MAHAMRVAERTRHFLVRNRYFLSQASDVKSVNFAVIADKTCVEMGFDIPSIFLLDKVSPPYFGRKKRSEERRVGKECA